MLLNDLEGVAPAQDMCMDFSLKAARFVNVTIKLILNCRQDAPIKTYISWNSKNSHKPQLELDL